MRLVSTAAQVREMDRATIEDLGVPGIALMESASQGVARAIRAHHDTAARQGVVVVCGGGNNGGDGYCVARWLAGWGYPVQLWSLTASSSGDAATNRDICRRMQIPEAEGLGRPGLIVDAVFGTGLGREVTGRYAAAISAMEADPAPVIAVDLPSGLHSDTGAVMGVAVHAVRTVTFGRLKPGLLAEPGADYCGVVEVVDIGLDAAGGAAVAEVPDHADLAPLWPHRAAADHKTRAGHLLVVAGSEAMTGAAILACQGALAVGVGLLTLVATRSMVPRLAALPPEVMVIVSGDGPRLEAVPEGVLEGRHALAAGPGLGAGQGSLPPGLAAWLSGVWADAEVPVVFDADGLAAVTGAGTGERLITPHPGEAARLLGCTAAEVQADRFTAASRLSKAHGVALLKGRNTLVAAPGRRSSVNPTGNPLLATGGSGDVLTGIVGGLLARGVGARDAARLGAFIHGLAADLLAAERPQGWTAADVADTVPDAIEALGLP